MIYIGIDNGSTGSIGILDGDLSTMHLTPTKVELNYQKTSPKTIARIDGFNLEEILSHYSDHPHRIGLERPMVNPMHFHATCSAVRSHEATLITFEKLNMSFEYIDSKSWQKMLLPAVKGSRELKKASVQVGIRLFPHLEDIINKRGDADGILIAEYLRRR